VYRHAFNSVQYITAYATTKSMDGDKQSKYANKVNGRINRVTQSWNTLRGDYMQIILCGYDKEYRKTNQDFGRYL